MSERDYFRPEFGASPRPAFWSTYPGTKAILIGLVGIHLVMMLLRAAAPGAWEAIWDALALHPRAVLDRFFVWQLVTGTLLHDWEGFWHLLVNCLMIFFFGRLVEQRLGLKRFLYFCLGAGVAASLAYVLWAVLRSDVRAMMGASGVAIGVTVLAALWFPRLTVLIFFVFPAQLWVLAAILVGLDLLQLLSVDSDIAHTAHLGGALYAFLYFRFGKRIEGVFDAIDQRADRKRMEREQRQRVEEAELRQEVDRILDKVNREGMNALSERERRFLKRASERLRG